MNQLVLFDYSDLTPPKREILVRYTGQIQSLVKRSMGDIIEIGKALIAVKELLPQGTFNKWLKDEFNWSRMTATRLMNVAQNFAESNVTRDTFAAHALYFLATPSTPESARQEALRRAESGERITVETAKEIKAFHIERIDRAQSQPRDFFEPTPPVVWTPESAERKALVLEGQSVVANKHTDIALIEWAKEMDLYVAIDRGTIWGNPFITPADGERSEVIKNFKWYYQHKPSLQRQIESLRGKVLGCWCYPDDCHGDILIEALKNGD